MFNRERGARILSLMWMVMSMAPMLAPIIGGQLFKYLGWESVFWVLTIFGVICLVLVVTVLGESLPPDRRTRHNPLEMATSYGELLIHRRFLGYSLCGSFLFAAMFAYISSTPFVFIGLYGVTEEQYGFLFAAHVAVMTVGAYINSRIVERFGLDPIIRWGAVWAATMGCVVLFFAATGIGGVAGLLIPFALMMFAVPLVSANAVAGAMGEFPHVAGTAAALTVWSRSRSVRSAVRWSAISTTTRPCQWAPVSAPSAWPRYWSIRSCCGVRRRRQRHDAFSGLLRLGHPTPPAQPPDEGTLGVAGPREWDGRANPDTFLTAPCSAGRLIE